MMNRSRSTSESENLRYPDEVRSGSIRPWLSRKRILEIVTSGNSSSSSPSTSPIDRWAAPRGSAIGPLEQHEAELADLQLVAVVQDGPFDALLVDVRPVQRAGVGD